MVQFVDSVPTSTHGGGATSKYASEAAELRAHPNVWGLIAHAPNRGLGGSISANRIAAFPADLFEAKTRKSGDGYDIYVRYVGK